MSTQSSNLGACAVRFRFTRIVRSCSVNVRSHLLSQTNFFSAVTRINSSCSTALSIRLLSKPIIPIIQQLVSSKDSLTHLLHPAYVLSYRRIGRQHRACGSVRHVFVLLINLHVDVLRTAARIFFYLSRQLSVAPNDLQCFTCWLASPVGARCLYQACVSALVGAACSVRLASFF